MGNNICYTSAKRKSSISVVEQLSSKVTEKLPEASAPPAPSSEPLGLSGKMDEEISAAVAAKMSSMEESPMAQVEIVQPEMEPDEESPDKSGREEPNAQDTRQEEEDSGPSQEKENKGSDPSTQAFYQGTPFSQESNSLRCCEGGSLSKGGFEIQKMNSYQSAAAFSTSKVASFTVEVTEKKEYFSESMILGFTLVPIDTAINKVSADDCEADDLTDTWCVTEKSVKMPTQLKLIDWNTREVKEGDKVTICNANGDFRIDLNGTNVVCIPDVLPREPLTAMIQPRGVHSKLLVS